jgi:hypothetical protein
MSTTPAVFATMSPCRQLFAEDHLQRLSLRGVGTLVEKHAHRCLGALPDIAFEVPEGDHIEPVERYRAIGSFSEMPNQNAIAIPISRGASEFARTWDVAFADVEPVAFGVPLENVGRRDFLFARD